ncbi:RNA demethylase ALKBH9B-like [Telopea speciosissima]|uniref:RNA demethylase ALKBH9B-like n=1 Tax=Telopea speciosissima TaxID=54955 RepID=UPI001CC768F9|nr:RNA demethylase ALKBH9B-like [Telopea speciosissima]
MDISRINRKKDFVHIEKINGIPVNILSGLELHTRVFDDLKQKKIVDEVYMLQCLGKEGQLKPHTCSEPKKWMCGKGRVTLQFCCCYNYVVDKKGNPLGIIQDEEVDSMPSMFKTMIKNLLRWDVLQQTCIPNNCIPNMYDEGDCIPPHIDHHDFLRPFYIVSFLIKYNILFGSNLKIKGLGVFSSPVVIPLLVGSILILNGNGADVAKHCVPSVPAKRISITF